MNPIDADDGNRRLFRRAMLAVCACFFLVGLTACNTRLSDNDFEERCKNVKSCIGNSSWPYASVSECVDDLRRVYEQFEGKCRRKYARAFNCESRKFQCKSGDPDYSGCQDQIDAFEEAGCV